MTVLRPLLLAVSFLTRIPTPLIMPEGREMGRSMGWSPLVGLLLTVPLLGLLGGLTGDVYGAAVEIVEVTFFIAVAGGMT